MFCVCIEVIYVCNCMCYVQRIELKLYFGELRFKKAVYYYYYSYYYYYYYYYYFVP